MLRALEVDELWLPKHEEDEDGESGVDAFVLERRVATETGATLRLLGAGEALAVGDLHFEVLWPPRGWRGNRNQRSLVLASTIGEGGPRALLPGDLDAFAESALLARLDDPRLLRSAILRVGHHGSRSSSSRRFLEAVRPEIAIASAACGRRGLPSPEAWARLSAVGASVWWTGRHGAVGVGTEPLHVRAMRPRSGCREAY